MPNHFPNREAILARQTAAGRELLALVISGNSFYREKLARAGLSEAATGVSPLIPFTTKSELADDQRAHPPFGTNLTFPLARYTRFHQTSGTAGAPLRWLDTPESWEAMVQCWLAVFHAAGVGPADRVYFAFSFGPFIGFWLAFEAATRLGCLCIPGGGLGSSARLRAILDNGATVICCTPTYALRLGDVAAEEKIDLAGARVRTFMVAGEPGGSIPATRARIAASWSGARVFDHHGMTEVGPVTHECPARPGVLHVMESAFLPEVIDPATGAPVAPGQTGELVLTTLVRVGSPLLRYRTGDLVKPVAADPTTPCACGRFDLALDGGILGRTDDMVIVRGVNVFPSAVEEIIRACGSVAEYRVTVQRDRAMSELAIEVEASAACANPIAIARELEQSFENILSLRIPVTTVAAGSLPRFEMKAKRWLK